jgi:hypothetical protein
VNILTVDVGMPEFSVATFKPFGRVVTLVSGTLYSDYIKYQHQILTNRGEGAGSGWGRWRGLQPSGGGCSPGEGRGMGVPIGIKMCMLLIFSFIFNLQSWKV